MKYTVAETVYEIDPMKIKWGESRDAANALGVMLDQEDFMAIHGINLWVAYRRANPGLSNVQVTDWVRSLEFDVLATVEAGPLGGGNGDQATTRQGSGTPA